MVWDVDIELVEEWLTLLDQSSYEQVIAALELLAERGRNWDDRWSTPSSVLATRT